jgi:hypothetical protein
VENARNALSGTNLFHEHADATVTPDEQGANMQAWWAYSEELGKAGKTLR